MNEKDDWNRISRLLLAGCSSQGSKNQTTCSGLVDGLDTEVVLNFDDNDQLVSMKAIGSMEADSEEQAEQLESMFSSNEDALKGHDRGFRRHVHGPQSKRKNRDLYH